MLRYLSDYKRESVLAPLFKMLEATFDLFVPLVMADIVNVGIAAHDFHYILVRCGILLLLAIVGLACSLTAQYFSAKAAVGYSTGLRHALFEHIQTLSFSEMDTMGTSTLITRMTSDVNQVQSGLNLFLRLFLRSPFVVIGAMIMAFTVNFRAALIFVVAIPLLSVVVFGVMVITRPLYKSVQTRLDRVLGLTRENLTGVRVVRAFDKERSEVDRFEDANELLTQMQLHVGHISALMNPLTYVIINLAIVALLYVGSIEINIGGMASGDVIALVNYMNQILVELVKLANLIVQVSKALACAGRVQAVLDTKPGMEFPAELTGNVPAEKAGDAVRFDHVSLTYKGAGAPSLSDINFTAKRGQTIGVIGGTGSGKSSLISLIPRFYDATEGSVEIMGRPVRQYPRADLRGKVAVVMQKAQLFGGTIRSNLLWGSQNASDADLWAALETAQAAEELKKYVKIVETDLEKAEFGDGVMVLPVSYTKGLEFDAVLLFDPTQEKYPSDNGHVKLLYVAATRALHELVVLHRGKLTGILADKVPEGKHMKEFTAETLTKAAEFERVQHTGKEIEQQRRIEGAKDMAEREYIGPKRIVIKPQGKENEAETRGKTLTGQIIPNVMSRQSNGTVQIPNSTAINRYQEPERAKMSMPAGQNMASAYKRAVAAPVRKAADSSGKNEGNHTEEIIISPYEFGAIPDNAILRVKGHSRNNFAIKWIKKTKSYVELSSMYGLLRITPITPEVIRVSFVKGVTEKIGDTAWKGKADTAFTWSAKESKMLVEIATEKVTVHIAKNNGAVCFYNEKKQLLLTEKAEEPRFQEGGCNWTFFDWEKSEHLKAKGLLAADFMDVTAKAKYVSYGGKKLRMPLILSEKGYGLAIASKGTVLFCGIRTFGPYIMAEGSQSDYYFISEKNREKLVEIYQKTLTLQPKF